ncbi:MAG: AraC family transcriptional regulator, partial [Pseudomonadales bacterium]|nr:AraC family transcriptional regulator [Pseudomonadales bacterium]
MDNMGVNYTEVLKRAELPLDLFTRKNAELSTSQYFRLWRAMEFIFADAVFPLRMVQGMSSEVFDPPVFAAYCSSNLNIALERIGRFKPLIGPMKLDLDINKESTQMRIRFLEENLDVPSSLAAAELAFFVQLARMATRERLIPQQVQAPCDLTGSGEYGEFFGITPERG